MDGSRFDVFTRTMAISRRGALKTLLSGAAAGAAAILSPEATEAAVVAAQEAAERRNPFRRAGMRCGFFRTCGRLAPCTGGFCTPIACSIDGVTYDAGDPNPDEPCQSCEPTRDEWTAWTNVADGTACESADGNPCLEVAGECILGDCVRDMVPNGTECGPGQVCCSGACCKADEGCGIFGCEEVTSGCLILGNPYDDGVTNPGNQCEVCTPAQNVGTWSDKDDNAPCGDNLDRFCCRGSCCGDGECCNAAGTCEDCPVDCTIGNVPYSDGDANPGNECQVCDSSRSTSDWSPASTETRCGDNGDGCCNGAGDCDICDPDCVIDGKGYRMDAVAPGGCAKCDPSSSPNAWTPLDDAVPCGESGDRFCCAGVCCDPGTCCNEDRVCEVLGGLACADCRIDRAGYRDGNAKPGNECQVCDSSRSTDAWSPVAPGTRCGVNLDRFCCNGVCCDHGLCCNDATGVCEEGNCGACVIEDVPYERGDVNPDNNCQYCDPPTSTDAWTNLTDRFPCTDNWDKSCCDGECKCGPVCSMPDGKYYFDGEANPEKDCEVCKYARDRVSWSPADDHFPCGDVFGQECCRGVCCADGECCYDGSCLKCDGCTIDDVFYPDQRIHPDNDCQYCDIGVSVTSWTNGDANAVCGPHGDQFCCNGDCCQLGACCNGDGVCASQVPDICDGCVIEDRFYRANAIHPENSCQYCHPKTSTDAWTSFDDDALCGDDFEQRCCDGVCCEALACCNEDRVCEVYGSLKCADCRIDRVGYLDGDPNPDVDCQICDPSRSESAWSEADDDAPCGVNGDQFCCAGVCCPPAECCTPQGTCERCECSTETGAAGLRASLTSACDVCCNGLCCGPDECCGDDGLCGPCAPGCTIAGVHYDDGARNPRDFCAVCNVLNPTAWSPRFHPDCPPPCIIDGVIIAYGTTNPLNECEHCDGGRSSTSWSPKGPNTRCGPGQDQFCCQGGCCETGACCTPDGACAVGGSLVCDGCDIDGGFYPNGERNPATVCQICDIDVSTTSWTNDDFWPCNDLPHRSCCHGVCCADGEVCRNGNTDASFCG